MTKRIASVWVIFVLAIFGVQISAAQGTTPPTGEIAFASDRSGTYQIYLMNADGSNVRQLTHETVNAYSPIWSPDGQKLAYGTPVQQGTDSYWVLKVVDADGSSPIQIAAHASSTYYFVWSSDSQWVIYAELLGAVYSHAINFHRVKADGTDDQLLNLPIHITREGYLNWIRFFSNGNLLVEYSSPPCDLDTTNPDGTNVQFLTRQICAPAAISPDGQHIVGFSGTTIVETNLQGNHPQTFFSGLTDPNRQDFRVELPYWISWSPNGYYISGAVVVSPKTGTATPGTQNRSFIQPFVGTSTGDDYWFPYKAADWFMSWSPDSQWVAYTTQDIDGHYEVAISQPIGTDQMILTSGSDNSQPAWRPIPQN